MSMPTPIQTNNNSCAPTKTDRNNCVVMFPYKFLFRINTSISISSVLWNKY